MFDYSDDEVFFLIVSSLVGVYGLFRWFAVTTKRLPGRHRAPLYFILLPAVCLGFNTAVINVFGDPAEVAGHVDYVLLFLAGAAACFWITVLALCLSGIHYRHDVVENGNRAASIAIAGMAAASAVTYAGANIGSGPTIWTTIIPAIAATLWLWLLWLALEFTTHLSETITIDRDRSTGIRFAGWCLATALILGRAAAGSWTSWEETFLDLALFGWPAIVVTAGAAILQRWLRPTAKRPYPRVLYGWVSASLLILTALVYVTALPFPEIGMVLPKQREQPAHR